MADRDTFSRRLSRLIFGEARTEAMRERRTSRRTRLSPDRVILVREILPVFTERAGRLLWVGCRRYTDDYPALLEAKGGLCWTTDIDPEAAPFGRAGRHRTGDLTTIDTLFADQRFDFILCNGVIGHGVDTPEAQRQAMQAMATLLEPGGLLLLGWNRGTIEDPRLTGLMDGLFAPAEHPRLPSRREVANSTHVYDLLERR